MKKVYLLLTLAIAYTFASGQIGSETKIRAWGSPKIGFFFNNSNTDGVSLGLEANVQYKSLFCKANYMSFDELQILGPDPREENEFIGLQIGKAFRLAHVFNIAELSLNMSAGVGTQWGVIRGERYYEEKTALLIFTTQEEKFKAESYTSIAFPIELELYHHIKFITFGSSVYAIINKDRPSYGFVGKIGFGLCN